ncbi:putative virion structural protein [Salmonella phage SPAsTU]|nr:putative virion structural protein [Salmonella phage SPAsTU]
MENWLVAHAVKNAWQRPYLDGVLNVAPFRLTEKTGAIGFFKHGRNPIPLPGSGWWHAYAIDKLHLNYGNLSIPVERWKKLTTCVNNFHSWMQVYNEDGTIVPSNSVYFWRTISGQIYMAIPQTDRYKWLDDTPCYLRIYAGYTGGENAPVIKPTTIESFSPPNPQQIQVILDRYNLLKTQKQGYVDFWVNGKMIVDPKPANIKAWDDVEIRVDGRIRRVIDYRCGDLRTFYSTLDQTRKYLLHIPKGDGEWIFNNDCEIQLLWQGEGRYYHRHRHRAMRQLTWNDLSIPSERISKYRNAFSNVMNDIDGLTIRLLIREDFLDLKPLYNSSHTHDLYRLSDDKIIDAMVGANANVAEWQAANLEESAANKVAAAKLRNITRDLATDAYGYNAVARYSADTPQRLSLTAGGYQAVLPDLLATLSTVYEYDADGLLLGSHRNVGYDIYKARDPAARIIEAIAGDCSDAVHIVDNAPDFEIEEGQNVGLWIRMVIGEVPTDDYYKAEEGTDYLRENNQIVWTVDRTRRHPTVIYDDLHLFFEMDVAVSEGEIRIPILARNQDGNQRTLWIPMETVEVWLNDHPLVHGIDYTVRWPELVVVCKAWMGDGDSNKVSVRCRGVTGTLRVPKHGFVSSGLLSNNNQFDARDDKVIRVVGGGSLLLRDEVVFREDNTIGVDIVQDGFPYSVDDPTIPLRTLVTGDTYALRDIARDLDDRVEAYLTNWFPTPPPVNPVPLPYLYHLYSPTLNKILWDYLQGILILREDDPDYRISTTQLDEIMKRYEDLLPFDPAYIGYDKAFVKMHPHVKYETVEINELGFAFLDRVNARYLNGEVQLNQYLKIKG